MREIEKMNVIFYYMFFLKKKILKVLNVIYDKMLIDYNTIKYLKKLQQLVDYWSQLLWQLLS
jgi:hypothetical protein